MIPQTSQGAVAPGPLIEEGGLTEIFPSLLGGEGKALQRKWLKGGRGQGLMAALCSGLTDGLAGLSVAVAQPQQPQGDPAPPSHPLGDGALLAFDSHWGAALPAAGTPGQPLWWGLVF